MVPHFITNRKVLLILGWTLSSSTICSYAEQNQASNANGNNKHYDAPNHIDRNKLHIKAIHNLRRQEKRIKTENVSSGHILNKQERTVSTSDEAIIKDRKSNSGSDPPEPMTRYIVKYKNELGRQSAINVAIKVYHNFDHDGYVVIEVDADGLARIQTDSNIESVEEDSVWFDDGILEEMFTIDDIEEKLYDVIPDHVRRHLSNDEQTPYGITMVQADQVQYGTNKVTVCIVDTGVRAEHPDFNPLLLSGGDRISTVDGTLMKWNNDTRGHGAYVTGTINAISINNF